jgi:hypothetical protein
MPSTEYTDPTGNLPAGSEPPPVSGVKPNGEDGAPAPETVAEPIKRRGRPPKTLTVVEPSEQPLPAAAMPPPAQSTAAQPGAPRARPDFNKARVAGLQPMQTSASVTRLLVYDKPDPAKFFCVHPEYGGFGFPVFLWKRQSSGKGAGTVWHMVSEEMAGKIADNGGDVIVGGLYWARYNKGGDFLLAVNLESDNPYTQSARDIYEKLRTEWGKRINMGGYYETKPPNVPIAPPVWESRSWEDIMALGFQEVIESEEHPDYAELVHDRAETGESGLSPMRERMARIERMAQNRGKFKA